MGKENLGRSNVNDRNPFVPRVKTTVKRTKEEVYHQGIDLSKPQYLGTTPLDKLFQRLEKDLEGNLDDITIATLGERLLSPEQLDSLSENELRYEVVKNLLQSLQQISQLSLLSSKNLEDKNLISVSLYDMKILGKIVNLIIILGIYPATMSFGIGIAMEKRRMSALGKANYNSRNIKPIAPTESGYRWAVHSRLLELIQQEFTRIFDINSDVSSLLLKGTGYSDYLVTTIALATVPQFESQIRERFLKKLSHVTSIPSTFELYLVYSVLLSSPCPQYFRSVVLEQLQNLPYAAVKGDGVLTLIEFIMGLRESEEASMEKMDQVSAILLLKPKTVSTIVYFTSIGTQCIDLLVNINRPIITSAVSHFMQQLWLKNSRVAQDFFFSKLQLTFSPPVPSSTPEANTVTVLLSEKELNNSINTLISISRLNLSTEAQYAFFSPIWLDMWSYFIFLKLKDKPSKVFEDILVSVLENMKSNENFAHSLTKKIADNLMYENESGCGYRMGPNNLVELAIRERNISVSQTPEKKVATFLTSLESSISCFVELLKRLEFSLAQDVFLYLLSKWTLQQSKNADENPFIRLLDLKLLEQIASAFKDDISKTPYDSLKMIHLIIKQKPMVSLTAREYSATKTKAPGSTSVDSDDEDDASSVAFSSTQPEDFTTVVYELLTAILQEARPGSLDATTKDELVSIRFTLEQSRQNYTNIPDIVSRIDELVKGEAAANEDNRQAQRKRLDRALAEINDQLVPVRAHGLFVLRQLIEEQSAVISVDFVVKTHITQLSDQDPFVYLNAIKGIESLLAFHNDKVLVAILDAYAGRDMSFSSLNDRLKLGEALHRFVQGKAKALTGKPAKLVAQTFLDMIRVSSTKRASQQIDDHLRMSAMSLLGMCFKTNVLGFFSELDDALDCALGMLQLETAENKAIMRRAALVMIHDVIAGTSSTDKVPFPREYQLKVLAVVGNVRENDSDILTREQAESVFRFIADLVAAVTTESTK